MNKSGFSDTVDYKNGVDRMNTTIQKSYSPLEAIAQSLKEVQLIREGKLPQKDWRAVFENRDDETDREKK